jgi:hypothetical protein
MGLCEPLFEDPTSQIDRRIQKLLSKHKTGILIYLKQKLIPDYTKHPHLYGLPKTHKQDVPLRPIVSSIGSPCYALGGFLQQIQSPLAGKSESFLKNSFHFVQLLKAVNLQCSDTLVSFDVSLFTDVPVEEALPVIREMLHNDRTLAERSTIQVDDMELLEVC